MDSGPQSIEIPQTDDTNRSLPTDVDIRKVSNENQLMFVSNNQMMTKTAGKTQV